MTHFSQGLLVALMMILGTLFVPTVRAEHEIEVVDQASQYSLGTIPQSDGEITGIDTERYICGLNSTGQPGDDCDQTTQGKLLFHYNISSGAMGNEIRFKIKNTGEPHYVHLDISLCWKTNNQNEMMCDEKISNLYNDETDYITMFSIRSNLFFIMIDAEEGSGGDQTSVKVSRQVVANSNNDRTEPETMVEGVTYNRKVCQSECYDELDDPVDIFQLEAFAGDVWHVIIWMRGNSGECEWYNDQKVNFYWREEYSLANYTTSKWYRMDETLCGEEYPVIGNLRMEHSGMMYFYFIAHGDDADQTATSYSIKFQSLDTSNRDTTADRDGDGITDVNESDCGSDYTDYNDLPLDHDSDGLCDNLDDDDDNDGTPDDVDLFPHDSTQWADSDGDGYGDNPDGNQGDQFPSDPTQWADSDGDGYGDNSSGTNPDQFPNDSTQWADSDGDGYGDNPAGVNPDSCDDEYGESVIDRFGCPDADGDGWSDLNDDCPFSSGTSSYDRKACPDTDGDGWSNPDSDESEHPNGNADAFPNEPTQWRNQDGDLFGDNPEGNNTDDCPTIWGNSTAGRNGCIDTDGDGWADTADWDKDDGSQWVDADGDGFGDNPKGHKGDYCPTIWGNSTKDRNGCTDTDGDGWSDDFDACDLDADNQCWGAVFRGQVKLMEAKGKTVSLVIFFICVVGFFWVVKRHHQNF